LKKKKKKEMAEGKKPAEQAKQNRASPLAVGLHPLLLALFAAI